VPRIRLSMMSGICLAGIGSAIAGCTVVARPVPLPPLGPMPLTVSQIDTGFVIRAAVPAPGDSPDHAAAAAIPAARPAHSQAPVALGDSVRIDRRAFISTNTKDIPHGEDR
jgi:hypothetical protein